MPTSLLLRYLLGLFLLLTPLVGRSQVVALDPVIQGEALGSYLEYWVDNAGSASFNDVVQQKHWETSSDDIPNFGFSRHTYWFRLDIQVADIQEPWLLQVGYNLLDDVRFYLLDESGKLLSQKQVGMLYPEAGEQRFNRTFLLPLTIEKSGVFTAYIRMRSDHGAQFPLYLWKTSEYITQNEQANIALGIFFGTCGILLLYNFFLYTLTRESLYLVFSGLVLALIAFHAQLRSLGLRMFFPEWSQWNGPVLLLTSLMATFMLALHAERFLQLEQTRFPLKKLFSHLRWLSLVTGFLLPWSRTEQGIYLMMVLISLTTAVTFIAVIYCYHRDDRPTRWFAASWILFFVSIMALAGSKLGILPYNVVTEHLISAGALVGTLMISMAMSDRINQAANEKLVTSRQVKQALDVKIEQNGKQLRSDEMERTAAEISLRLQTENNERLLREMDLREEELDSVAQQLREAARIDAQTAVFNRGYFNARLKEEFERSVRAQQRLSLILINVAQIESFVQRFGFKAGDDVMRQAAGLIESVTQHHCASVYRYDESIFSVILPGVSVHRAQAIAEMIRAAFDVQPFLFAGQILKVSISVGMGSLMPEGTLRPETLVTTAERALDTAQENQLNALAVNADKGG